MIPGLKNFEYEQRLKTTGIWSLEERRKRADVLEVFKMNKTAKMTAQCALYLGALKNFRESLSTPTATSAEIFYGLLFQSILWMCVQNLKFVALLIPEIIGGTQKIWAVPGYAHTPFSAKFFMGFDSDGPCECIGQICSPQLYPFLR